MNILHIVVDNPDELLNAGGFGAGALVRVESSADGVTYTELGTEPIVTETTSYTFYHSSGTSSTYYRSRYSDTGGAIFSDYSAPFQLAAEPGYTSIEQMKLRIDIDDNDDVDDAVLDELVDEANDWLEGKIGFPVRPMPTEERFFDGSDVVGGILSVHPYGIRSLSSIRYTTSTGGTYSTITSADWTTWLRPTRPQSGWPYFEIVVAETTYLSDWPTDGLRLIGVTGAWGWPAVPAKLSSIATRYAISLYHSRGYGTGQSYAVGEDGAQQVSDQLTGSDWRTILNYKSLDMVVG